jgi:hypothetical protein
MKDKKKPRSVRVGLGFDRPVVITGMNQHPDGSLTFFGEDGEPLVIDIGSAGLSYDRQKGPKVTVNVPDDGNPVGSVSAALARYDRIVGVDTNSIPHDGERLCVTVVCELSNVAYEGPRWSGQVSPLWALEFRDPTKDPERIGWRHALARGEELGWLQRSLLLVVDAHLGDLPNINQRKAPVIDDFLLPYPVSIAYASADTEGDSPLNALISRCDRLAGILTQEAIAAHPDALVVATRTPFKKHRYWGFQFG